MSGRRRKQFGRPLDGLLILDKPKGETSNHALQTVKRLFKANKAGHTGSLDPLATGLLPICFGEATKFSQFLLDSDKTYRVTAKLGIKTITGDAEGEVLETRAIIGVDRARLLDTVSGFLGSIKQVPPMYSALKHQGRPLYKLAREGIEVDRPARQIQIFKLELLAFDGEDFELEVACSKGTYIRSLVEDIGEVLGCGAHVTVLRRLQSGPFFAGQMHTMEAIESLLETGGLPAIDNLLLPLSASVSHWPSIVLDENSAYSLKQGQRVQCPQSDVPSRLVDSNQSLLSGRGFNQPLSDVNWEGQAVQIWEKGTDNKHFLGIGAILEDGRLAPRRLIKLN